MLSFANETDFFTDGSGIAPSTLTVTAFVNEVEVYSGTLESEVPHVISSIAIGGGFTGFVEGIGIDARIPSESDITNPSRTEANFLPQCLCPADSVLAASEEICSFNATQKTSQR